MDVSSRPPEGVPNRCPVCGESVVPGPSEPAGDTPCSHCGHLRWLRDKGADQALTVRFEAPDDRAEPAGVTDVTAAALGRLRQAISSRNAVPRLVLDFSSVAFLSSKALGRLITLHRAVQSVGGRLQLREVRPELRELFRATRLARLFENERA